MRRLLWIGLFVALPSVALAQAPASEQSEEETAPAPGEDAAGEDAPGEDAAGEEAPGGELEPDAAAAAREEPAEAQRVEVGQAEPEAQTGEPVEEARTPADAAQVIERPPPEGIPTGADETFLGGEPPGAEEPPPEAEEMRELPPPEIPGPVEEEPPLLEAWWFWVSIGAVVLGITLAIIVDVTTDAPRPDLPDDPEGSSMGLGLRF